MPWRRRGRCKSRRGGRSGGTRPTLNSPSPTSHPKCQTGADSEFQEAVFYAPSPHRSSRLVKQFLQFAIIIICSVVVALYLSTPYYITMQYNNNKTHTHGTQFENWRGSTSKSQNSDAEGEEGSKHFQVQYLVRYW